MLIQYIMRERYFEMTTATQTVNKISEEAKLLMAVESIKHPDMTIKSLAEMFRVSPTSVRRAVKSYAQQAEEFIAAQEKEQRTAIEPVVGNHGYKPRNGRVQIHNEVFAELGVDADSNTLYEECTRRAVEAGLSPIAKSSFYSMLSAHRKGQTKRKSN